MICLIPITTIIYALEVAEKFKEHIYRNRGLPEKKFWKRSYLHEKILEVQITSLWTNKSHTATFHPEKRVKPKYLTAKLKNNNRIWNFRKDNWDEYLVEFEVEYN